MGNSAAANAVGRLDFAVCRAVFASKGRFLAVLDAHRAGTPAYVSMAGNSAALSQLC